MFFYNVTSDVEKLTIWVNLVRKKNTSNDAYLF